MAYGFKQQMTKILVKSGWRLEGLGAEVRALPPICRIEEVFCVQNKRTLYWDDKGFKTMWIRTFHLGSPDTRVCYYLALELMVPAL